MRSRATFHLLRRLDLTFRLSRSPSRYIDWTITTPLLLLELALATGLPLPKIFNLIFLDIVMVSRAFSPSHSLCVRFADSTCLCPSRLSLVSSEPSFPTDIRYDTAAPLVGLTS